MGEYIGDKSRNRSGQSGKKGGSSGDTKQYDIVRSNSKSSSASGKSNSAKSSSTKSGSTKSNSAKSSQSKSASQQSRSSSSKTAYSGAKSSGSANKTSSSAKNTSSAKNSSAKGSSSSKNSSSSGRKSTSGSAAHSNRNSSAKTQSNRSAESKKAYSESLEAKKGSAYERELRSSDRARDIKNARRRRNYTKHRKLFNFMFYAAIFVAVVAVVIIMSVTVLFGIQDINVIMEPEVPYTETQIVSSCDVRKGQNLFLAPIEGAGEQIMQQLPYIENCSVTRQLPSTVVIRATAAEPSCMVRDAAGRMLVVSTGMRTLEYVVSAGDVAPVPVIEGVLASASDIGEIIRSADMNYFRVAIKMVKTFDEYGLVFDSITFSAGGNITAVYDGRVTINMGTSANIDDKLQLAAVLLNEGKITKHERGNLDLSIDGRATFTPDYVKKED